MNAFDATSFPPPREALGRGTAKRWRGLRRQSGCVDEITHARPPCGAPKAALYSPQTIFLVRRHMAINYDEVMQLKATGLPFSYKDRDTILYALGIGFGRDPLNEAELPFVYENGLRTVP